MTSPIATVEAFLARMADPGGFGAAVREWFTDATVYENIGMTRTTGIDEALAVVTSFEQGFGADSLRIDTLAIAATGSRVLTERIDHFVKPDGTTVASLPVMGIFEVADGKIAAWRDYFDTAGFRQG